MFFASCLVLSRVRTLSDAVCVSISVGTSGSSVCRVLCVQHRHVAFELCEKRLLRLLKL